MPFDSSAISDVSYKVVGASLRISWVSTAGALAIHQIYVNGRLQWHERGLQAAIPIPSTNSRIEIGAVGTGEGLTDFSAGFPPAPKSRAVLTWQGGTFEGADIQGFRIYGEATPGGGLDYDAPLADIQAYVEGAVSDGYGVGGYGLGGYGSSPASFSWESQPYHPSGSYTFAVVPFDSTGNEGDPLTTVVALTSPPLEVPLYSDGLRLHRVYNQPAKTVAISWQASLG